MYMNCHLPHHIEEERQIDGSWIMDRIASRLNGPR
jgi:hypothetical protein